jgi:uncharacterized protein with ParB-like and HNH nuclease domain
MKANEVQFVSFLSNNQQFVIPIYQRTYSWGINQCYQLWEDILKVIRNDISAHFIGSIVYVSDGLYTVAETPSYLVIDGQQRLTTLLIKLAQIQYFKDLTQKDPVFLIDDLMSELDSSNRDNISNYLLSSDVQFILTTAERFEIPENLFEKSSIIWL